MALFSRLRLQSLAFHRRNFSTILSPNSTTPLTSKQKTRAALSLLKSEKNPEKILEICRAASLTPESHLDRIAMSVAVSKLSGSNNFSYIQQFLDELRSIRSDFHTERLYGHCIVLFGQANMLDHAVRTFKEFHSRNDVVASGSGSVKSLNALLFACILAKNYSELKRIFLEFPTAYNIEPNLDTYNTVIKGFSESNSSCSAYSVLAEMKRKGLKPNKTTFAHVLAGFYREEKYEDAGKLGKIMTEEYGIRPGISIYNVRIQSLCKLGRAREAKALFDGLLSRGMKPNSATFSHLIHGFGKEGNLEEAKSLFKNMINRGCQPDADCYFSLVFFLCKGGDFESALKICEESIGKQFVPNFSVMKSLVEGLAKIGKVDEAQKLVEKMKNKFTKNVHLWEEVEAGLPK